MTTDQKTRVHPLVELTTHRPVALSMVVVAILVFGFICYFRLPTDLMPDINYPSITVRTEYPGAAPEDVEDRIARRLEQSLSVVRNLRRISSISRAELSDVILEFRWDADMKLAVQDIREKLDQTILPDDADRPVILRYDPTQDPILQIGLTGSQDQNTLRKLAEDEIERRLESVEGVAAVKVRGGLEDEVRVAVDEERARSRGVSIDEISQRLAQENLDQASGLLEDGNVTYVVRTRNEFRSLEEIRNLPIRRDGESNLRLEDVATVFRTSKEEKVITRIAGRPAVRIEIFREGSANIVQLADRVKERLFGTEAERQQLKKWRERQALLSSGDDSTFESREPDQERRGANREDRDQRGISRPDYIAAYLSDDSELTILSDQSIFVDQSIRDLINAGLIGLLLTSIVLYLFLGRFSVTASVLLSIPFSVLATFVLMFLGGISLNIMSLGGLALGIGMVVDSSIVVLEAISRRREAGDSQFQAALRGASGVAGAVFASTMTTIAVFFPIVFVTGVAGQLFRDQALTVVFSLFSSLVASLTIIPPIVARLGERDTSDSEAEPARPHLFWIPHTIDQVVGNVTAQVELLKRICGSPRIYLKVPGWILAVFLAVILLICDLIYWSFWGLVELLAYFVFVLYLLALLITVPLRYAGLGIGWLLHFVYLGFNVAVIRVERVYVRLLRFSLAAPAVVGLLVVVGVVVAVPLSGRLGGELIPAVSQGEFVVSLRYPVGTPLEKTAAFVRPYEDAIQVIPEVETVSLQVGSDPEDVTTEERGEHVARLWVRIERGGERIGVVEERVIRRVSRVFEQSVDHTVEITKPVLFSFKTPVEVEVRGNDLEQLATFARQVEDLLGEIPEITDVSTTVLPGSPEYHIYPDRDKMMRYGVTSQQFSDALRKKNLGEVATRFREKERKIDIRVQLEAEDRESIDELLESRIVGSTAGRTWPLKEFVQEFSVKEGPAEIRRIDQQRAAIVSANIQGLDLSRVSDRIESQIFTEFPDLPPSFRIEIVGQKKEMEESQSSLLAALLLAVFLVYVVMASQFESLLQPLIILFSIPLAGVGVVVTLWLTGLPLSIMAFIGMIILAGIVVNNAIVLVDQINALRAEGVEPREAIVEGSMRRLRPILMTTLTTVLAMIPVTGLIGSGEGAEIRAPMAFTVIGGLSSSTFLTLILIPVLYGLVVRKKEESLA